ncbi:MAG: DUF2723 domain-containing protein [Candidatus Eremiobacteraeota bacterium]|nr:DUF2723 domain-containing protein [Candidatus Eremiobacteraeota bacterium]
MTQLSRSQQGRRPIAALETVRTATWCGVLLVFVSAALYLATAQREPAFWDTGEMQVVPWIFGIAHPTGFPAFVLGGYAFAHVVALGSVAWRMAAFSALAVVVATFALYRTALRLTGHVAISFGASLLFATCNIVWLHATRAEVHALSLGLVSVAVLLAVRFHDGEGDANLRYAGVAYGLALATHPVALWAAPGLLLIVARASALRKTSSSAGAGAVLALQTCACVVLAATLPYGYLPLRSAAVYAARRDPTLSLGFAPGMPFWDYAHTAVPKNLWWLVTGQQFDKADGLAVYTHPLRWAAVAAHFIALAGRQFTPLGVAFALVGALTLVVRRLQLAAGLLAAGFLGVPFAFAYSLEADKDRYLLLALWMMSLFVACGASAAVGGTRRWVRRPLVFGGVALAGVLIALAGWDAWNARGIVAIERDLTARRYITATERISTPTAIVVAPWVYATPLAYAAYVERNFGRRIVVTAEPQSLAGRMAAWSNRHCVIAVWDRPALVLKGLRVSRPLTARAPFLFRVTAGPNRCVVRGNHA